MDVEKIAQVCHEVNRIFCKSHGDESQPSWEDAPQWQKDSAICGVDAHRLDPGMTPEDSHKGWLRHKEKDGWVYGPVKDPDKKRHPCMMPYEQLPVEQRMKDDFFTCIVSLLIDYLD